MSDTHLKVQRILTPKYLYGRSFNHCHTSVNFFLKIIILKDVLFDFLILIIMLSDKLERIF